ncbi:hypothetical protein ACOWO9_09760 [Leuconostoc mesenteroides]|uniref:hypothetical protein n=1 Tax=Leuconostoc mesenteroides TaxID=1245 RepID=UPI003C35273A
MQKDLISFWLYLYLSCIYFLPLVKLMRSSKQDSQFLLRKLLFPLEYLIQVKLEKTTNYSRSAIRLGHILVWLFSIFGLMLATVPMYIFDEPYENHTSILLFILNYSP